MPTAAPLTDTREQLLDHATELIEIQGFCAFSYADLAERVGIRKPSIHHHFPTKSDLGVAVVERSQVWALGVWADLEQECPKVSDRVRRLFAFMRDMGRCGSKICRVGALQSEFNALPEPVQIALRSFSETYVACLTRWLDEGRRAGDLIFPGAPRAMAQVVAAATQASLQRHRCNPSECVDATLDQLERLLGL